MSFALWDPNVSSWEIGERMGMLFVAILLIILDKVFCAIKSIVNADDDYDYDDEFLTEEEMEMRMKQEERYNQNQQRGRGCHNRHRGHDRPLGVVAVRQP